jgi:hypothetical protein
MYAKVLGWFQSVKSWKSSRACRVVSKLKNAKVLGKALG